MRYNTLSVGKKTPKTAHSTCDFVTLPEENRVMAIGNMHRKTGKDRACGSINILADRQTDRQKDRQTDRHTDIHTERHTDGREHNTFLVVYDSREM